MSLVKAPWLARRVLILLLPVSDRSFTHITLIEKWLAAFHAKKQLHSNRATVPIRPPFPELLREALAVDMGATVFLLNNENFLTQESLHFTPKSNNGEDDFGLKIPLKLSVVGREAIQPNLDHLAIVLSLIYASQLGPAVPELVTEIDVGSRLKSARSNSSVPVPFLCYLQKLVGILLFGLSTLTGSEGVHGSFMAHDLDAATIQLTQSIEHNIKSPLSIYFRSNIRRLRYALCNYFRACSNLHEELHHSEWLWPLLGPNMVTIGQIGPNLDDNFLAFVGLSEYGLTSSFVLAPLLLALTRSARYLRPVYVSEAAMYTLLAGMFLITPFQIYDTSVLLFIIILLGVLLHCSVLPRPRQESVWLATSIVVRK